MKKFLNPSINTIFIMLGEACNLQCKYCMQHEVVNKVLSKEINPSVIEFIKDIAGNQKNPVVLQFYGGEPLLYYENIQKIVDELIGHNVHFSVITNGKLLDYGKVEFFNKYKFSVAISYDGENSSETRGFNAIENIKEHIMSLNNVCLTGVLTTKNYPLDFLEHTQKINDEYHDKNGYFFSINTDDLMDVGLQDKSLKEFDFEKLDKQMRILCSEYEGYFLYGTTLSFNKINFMEKHINMLRYHVKNFKSVDLDFSIPACVNGYGVLNVDLDGNLYRCHNARDLVGTIHSNYLSYLRNVIALDPTKINNTHCKECYVQELCRNGCPLVNQDARDDYYCNLKVTLLAPIIDLIIRMGGGANGG